MEKVSKIPKMKDARMEEYPYEQVNELNFLKKFS